MPPLALGAVLPAAPLCVSVPGVGVLRAALRVLLIAAGYSTE
jgi:hypothetical protein